MINFPLPRIDTDGELTKLLLPYCRFKKGFIWEDRGGGHARQSLRREGDHRDHRQPVQGERAGGSPSEDPQR